MKKILAVVLSLMMVFCFSVTAFAASSPQGTTYHKVVTMANATDKYTVEIVPYTEGTPAASTTFTAKRLQESDQFVGWSVYKKDGTLAVAGVDYTIVTGTTATALGQTMLQEETIVLIANTDLIVTANWNNELTSTKTAQAAFAATSDKTGDTAAAVAVFVGVLALAGVAVSKKQLAK